MTPKVYRYEDRPIIHKDRLYYLRQKTGIRGGGSSCVLTVRTHRNGKGKKIAQVKGVINAENTLLELHHKLYKKFKFQFLQYVDLEPLPK